ncbi:MAG: methionyl-tRNA formyltransferase, partial [Spirochaetia bacterium]|nr:methionyl-tRNA formyltransferase [Spirochaetia bacterium]
MKKIVVANINPLFEPLIQDLSVRWDLLHLRSKADLTPEHLNEIDPSYIFFPHWSFIIPSSIYEKFECIVFHMTDLPYGRGGSPLQNLILRGHKKTMLSALRVIGELDSGPVYLKRELMLEGAAHEIFSRAAVIIRE